ncbi:SAV_2336 N-terminal domain-related protein [Streptomyces sp. AC555_RSS877]|uniref:SAV_2336 N-terminal domain-related protein n=1 Tax=Streptomyces sp. AC555_RSS877 TaxID=2823688 RepID=UPI0027E4BEA0|nr:SAV_2336 N-terminal domain-related protein [Streptomyces sp. AC555_RSS877]
MSSGTAESGEPDKLRTARLHAALRIAGAELSPRELCDALWLALHEPPHPAVPALPEPDTAASAPHRTAALHQSDRPQREAAKSAPREDRRSIYTLTRTRNGGAAGAPIRIPAVRGLRHPLDILRGLRALKRKVPSTRRHELDENATAEAIADSGVLDAVLRPATERWLHLVLAIDDGPSMRVWRDTIDELADSLTGSGIFHSVRVSPLAASAPLAGDRTVVLVVTDAVADHWYTGAAHARLAALARRAPTAVLHLLPTRLWSSTGLSAQPVIVRSTGPAPPNTLLTAHAPWHTAPLSTSPRLPVPVLELDEPSLRPWAELIASHGGMAALRVIDAEDIPEAVPVDDDATDEPVTAAERVQTFRATTSPHAYELASHLAAVDPLTLPVMRLVQAAALPDSTPVCLAEVMLSGLMHVDDPLEDQDVFAFEPDLRQVLRTVINTGSAQRTVDAVSDFITPRLGRTPEFPAVIADRTGTLTLPREGEPLAELHREGDGRAYTSRDLLHRLTNALVELGCMEDRESRLQFAAVLGDQLGRSVDLRGVRQREDVVALVQAALHVAGGEDVLLNAVRILEGEVAAAELEQLLTPPGGARRSETGTTGPISNEDTSSVQALLDKPREGRAPTKFGGGKDFDLLYRLTNALVELGCMEDRESRLQFAALLGDQLGLSVDLRGVKQREDIIALVQTALDVAGGEHVLLAVVRICEGPLAATELEQLLMPRGGVGRWEAGPSGPLSHEETNSALALLGKPAGNPSETRLRELLADQLGGADLPTGLSLTQLFHYLLDFNAQPDGLPPAVLLMECAAQSSLNPSYRRALSDWAEDWARRSGLLAQLERRRAYPPAVETDPSIPRCLVIVVEHTRDGSGEILVRPWLNTVPGQWNPQPGEPATTTLDGLGTAVERALRQGARLWSAPREPEPSGRAQSPPYIEFVLPNDLLNYDVAGLTTRIGDGGPLPLGLEYGVHVRSLERMRASDALVRERWQERWRALRSQGVKVHGWSESDAGRLDAWQTALAMESDCTAVVLDAPDGGPATNALNAAIAEGIGIAVWDRRGELADERREVVSAVFASVRTPDQIPMAIHRLRRNAEVRGDGPSLLGRHIALMWDDPTRLVDLDTVDDEAAGI